MRYFIYSRVSTNKQSTQNQLSACEEKFQSLKQEGDTLQIYDEADKSTRLPLDKRPVLQKLMKDLKKGDVLIIFKIDRLSRSVRELPNIFLDIREKGIKIISVVEGEIPNVFIGIYSFIADSERNNVSNNTKNHLRQKRMQNEKYGHVPYGWALDPNILQTRENTHTFGKPYKLIRNEAEQAVIALIVDLYNQGLTYGRIADVISEKGHMTRSGTPMGKMQVYRIIHRQPDAIPSPEEAELSLVS